MKTFTEFQEEVKVLFGKPKSHSEKVTKKLNKFSATFDLNKSPKFGLKILGQQIPPKSIEVKKSLTPSTAIDRALEKYKGEKKVNESVAALKGSKKLIPALMTGIGAVGTIKDTLPTFMQAKRKYKTRNNPTGRVGIKSKGKREIGNMEKSLEGDRSNNMINAKPGEVQKQNKLIDKYEKKQKSTENNLKRRNFVKRLKGDIPEEAMAAPTNSTGPAVPGTGDDSSTVVVKKKKRYIYGGRGSRKMWMNNK